MESESQQLAQLDDLALFGRALEHAASETDDAEEAYWQCVVALHLRGTAEIFELASAAIESTDDTARVVACDVLAQLGVTAITPETLVDAAARRPPFAQRSAPLLIACCATDTSPEVIAASILALGHLGVAEGAPVVLSHVGHADADVRHAIAWALRSLVGDDELSPPHPVVGALIELCADVESSVRDWATFVLGSLLTVDGAAVRDCLRARLDDDDPDTADEALIGLARRHDPTVVEYVLRRLGEGTIGRLVLEAAAVLGDPVLFEPLQRWSDPFSDEPDLIEEALRRCTPGRADEEARTIAELAAAAHGAGLPLTVACDIVGDSNVPTVAVAGFSPIWAFDGLMRRAGGSADAAVRLVIMDINTQADEVGHVVADSVVLQRFQR